MLENHVIHLANGRLTGDTTPDRVRAIVQQGLADAGDGGLVVHLHGGLVNRAAGLEVARNLLPVYTAAGAHPVFPVWESGLLETIRNNLPELAGEGFFKIVWQRIYGMVRRKQAQGNGHRGFGALPVIDLTDADRGIAEALQGGDPTRLPPEDVVPLGLTALTENEQRNLEAELGLDAQLKAEVAAIANGLRTPEEIARDDGARAAGFVRGSTTTLMDREALDRYIDRPDPGSRGLLSFAKVAKAVVTVGARTVKRFVGKRDHGLHATIVEEILREFYVSAVGGVIWSLMKKDTADSFGPDPGVHGGTALLHDLRELVGAGPWPRLTLVGHSTGAVYICEFLKAADAVWPAGVTCDVVFLAPAVTCELMAATLDNHRARIGRFRMFTMTDAKEQDDRLVPVVYPHSLLYFVSGVVEDGADMPLVGMQRYYRPDRYAADAYPDVAKVREYLEAADGRTVWSVTDDGPGRRSAAVKHADFDNEQQTLQSVREFLAEG